jgi:hypothetical protein
MRKLGLLAFCLIIIAGVCTLFFINSKYQKHKNDLAEIASKRISNTPQNNPLQKIPPKDTRVKSFRISVTESAYSPNLLRVRKGEVVEITLYSKEGYSNFSIDPLGIRSKLLATKKTDTFRFVATMSGVFEFKSDTYRYYGFTPTGTLIVE